MDTDFNFVNKLIKEGKLRQCKYPWHEYYQIVDHPTLKLQQEYEFVTEDHCSYTKYGYWHVWTYRYTFHVTRLERPLQEEWAMLDYNTLEALQQKLDYEFSQTPDF